LTAAEKALENQLPWGKALKNALGHAPGCHCPLCTAASPSMSVRGLPFVTPAGGAADVSPATAAAELFSGSPAPQSFEVSTFQGSLRNAVLLSMVGDDFLTSRAGHDFVGAGTADLWRAADMRADVLLLPGHPLAASDAALQRILDHWAATNEHRLLDDGQTGDDPLAALLTHADSDPMAAAVRDVFFRELTGSSDAGQRDAG
jgi:hypothetical protein